MQFSEVCVTGGWADSTDSVEYANIDGWLFGVDALMEKWQADGVKDAATKCIESYNHFRHDERTVLRVNHEKKRPNNNSDFPGIKNNNTAIRIS